MDLVIITLFTPVVIYFYDNELLTSAEEEFVIS